MQYYNNDIMRIELLTALMGNTDAQHCANVKRI
jgi:hypothetical protein